MKLFLGEFTHALDDRGRVTLPRKIRQDLGGDVILSRGFDTCMFGYDREDWEREAKKHLETSITDKTGREVRRYMFSGALNVEIDKLGRIVLPAHLKEYAGIKSQVAVVGAGDHFEIWDCDRWMKYQLEHKDI